MTMITFEDILGIIVIAALGSYFIVGLAVVLLVVSRRPKRPDQPLPRGMLWESKDHEWNTRWWFLVLTMNHPVLIVLHVVFWPVWFMAYLDLIEAEEEDRSTPYLGPTDDDDV
jgi:hypothetical protein